MFPLNVDGSILFIFNIFKNGIALTDIKETTNFLKNGYLDVIWFSFQRSKTPCVNIS